MGAAMTVTGGVRMGAVARSAVHTMVAHTIAAGGVGTRGMRSMRASEGGATGPENMVRGVAAAGMGVGVGRRLLAGLGWPVL